MNRSGDLPKADGRAPSDEDLVQRARQGEDDAFALLVQRHQRGVVNLAHRLVGDWQEALDLGQEVFLRVYQNLERFDDRRPFRPWLYRLATHRCYDHLRQRSRRPAPAGLDEAVRVEPATDNHPEGQVLRGEVRQAVEEVIASLSPRYRAVVVLRYLEGLSYEEIARALDMPLGTVKTCIHRAREQLRAALEKKGFVP